MAATTVDEQLAGSEERINFSQKSHYYQPKMPNLINSDKFLVGYSVNASTRKGNSLPFLSQLRLCLRCYVARVNRVNVNRKQSTLNGL